MKKTIGFLLGAIFFAVSGGFAQNKLDEGFESYTFPPEDWVLQYANSGSYWEWNSSMANGNSSGCAYMDYSGTYSAYLITPSLKPQEGDSLIFYLLLESPSNYNSLDVLTVEVSTLSQDSSTMEVLETVWNKADVGYGITSDNAYYKIAISLEDYEGQDIYLAFHKAGQNGGHMAIDDVAIVGKCSKISGLASAGVTSSSINLSWNAKEDVSEYYVYYKTADDEDYTMIGTTYETSYTLEGLDAGTAYSVYVTFDCDGTEVSSAALTVYTAAEPVALPFFTDFEEDNSGVSIKNVDGVNHWIIGTDTYTGEDEDGHSLYVSKDASSYAYDGYTASNSYAIINFETGDGMGYLVEFDAKCENKDAMHSLHAFVIPADTTLPTTYYALPTTYYGSIVYSLQDQLNWTKISKEITLTPNTAYQLVFFFTNDSWGDNTNMKPPAVDNISIKEVTCPVVASLKATEVTAHTATITWESDASSFIVEYFDGEDTVSTVVTDTQFELSDLPPQTYYTIYVKADCGAEQSGVKSVSFTTAIACKVPSAVTASDVTSNSAVITWTANNEETAWKVYYRKTTAADWDSIEVYDDATVTLSDLSPSSSYYVCVASDCEEEGWSSKSSTYTLKTECVDLTEENLPYATSFEEYSNVIPNCWTKLNPNSTYPYAYNSTSYANTGNKSLYMYSNYNGNNFVALPAYIGDVTQTQLSVYLRPGGTSSYYGSIELGYVTDLEDTNTYVAVKSFPATSWTSSVYKECIATYEDVTLEDNVKFYPTIKYVAAYNYYTWYADDVEFGHIPSCDKIYNATADALPTSATIKLNDAKEGITYNLYYKKTSDSDWSDAIEVTDNQVELTGLTSQTNYQYKIETICEEDGKTYLSKIFTFKTACAEITELPWVEEFTDMSNTDLGCWTAINNSSNSWSFATNYYSYIYSMTNGGKFAYVAFGDSEESWLISPIFDLSETQSPYISFYSCRPKYSSKSSELYLYYRTSPDGEWVELWSEIEVTDYETAQGDTGWAKTTVALPEPSTTYQFAFKNIAKDSDGTGLDSVYVWDSEGELVVCSAPAGLKAEDVTPTSATVTWVESDYSVEATYTNANGEEVTETITGNSLELTDLNPGTDYTVTLKTVCSEDLSSDEVSLTFRTKCVNLTDDDLPYIEKFDDYTSSTGLLPNCWTRLNTSHPDYPYIYSYGANTPSPTNAMYFYYNGTSVALPAYEGDITATQLELYLRPVGNNATDYGYMLIGVMTDPTDATTLTVVDTIKATEWSTPTSFEPRVVKFSDYEADADAEVYYPVIKYESTNGYGWYIDNITFGFVPECETPTSVTVSEITSSGAKVTWNQAGDNISSWIVYYKESDATDWQQETANETEYSFSDLAATTTYEVKVAAVCGGSEETYPTSIVKKFTTTCEGLTEADLPKTWDFENDNTAYTSDYPMPTCWIKGATTSSSSNYPYVSSSSWAVINGGQSLYIGYAGNYTAVLPILDESLDVSTLQVSFTSKKYYGSGYNANILVGVMTDPTDIDSFTEIESIALTNSAEEYVVSLASYTGEGKYIALRSETSDDYVFVDDLTLEKIPACATSKKSSVAATGTQAVVTIEDAVEGTSYNVYYRKSGATEWSDAVAVSDSKATITGLDASSSYEYYVETVCEDGENTVSKTKTFKTACGTVTTLPWVEEFTDMTNTDLGCWTANNGTKPWKFTSSAYNNYIYPMTNGGNFAYTEYGTGASSEESWLISPIFDLSAQTAPYISFYSCRPKFSSSSGTSSELYLYYRTSDSEEWVELFSEIDETDYETAQGSTGWAKTTVALPNPSATYQFAFKSVPQNSDGIGLDSVYVYNDDEAPVPCAAPTNLASSNVTETSFTVSWTGTAAKYNVQRDNEAAVEVTTNTYTFNGLTAGTEYTVKVQSVCEDGTTSAWSSSLSVTTTEPAVQPCNEPTDLAVTGQTQNSVTIVWTGNASSYDVQLDNGTIQNTTATTYTFNNLTPNTSYTAKVRSNCGEDKTSDWVTISFKTDPAGAEDCVAPTNVQAVSVTQTGATITWEGEADSYDVQVGISEPVTVSAKSYECTGLTANTTYTVKVRANCSDEKHSDWVSVTFKTQES
ncbi:MAG: fibronectin type III domain-containing protein, partial [Bacteroidales bacterium]|nr:fibronectin type III domain-containing protein [Bacteroidales bacterium]